MQSWLDLWYRPRLAGTHDEVVELKSFRFNDHWPHFCDPRQWEIILFTLCIHISKVNTQSQAAIFLRWNHRAGGIRASIWVFWGDCTDWIDDLYLCVQILTPSKQNRRSLLLCRMALHLWFWSYDLRLQFFLNPLSIRQMHWGCCELFRSDVYDNAQILEELLNI